MNAPKPALKRWWYKLWCVDSRVYRGLAPMSITAGWGDDSGCFMKSEFRGRGYTPWYWYERVAAAPQEERL